MPVPKTPVSPMNPVAMRTRLATLHRAGSRLTRQAATALRARAGARPLTAAAALMAALAFSTWSCQSPQRATPAANLSHIAEPDINVRIRKAVEKVELSGPRLVFVSEPGAGGGVMLRTPVTITRAGGGVLIAEAGRAGREYPSMVEVTSGAPRARGVQPTVQVDGTPIPGRIRIIPRDPEAEATERPAIDVVAAMPVETYLPGVVAKELMGGWPDHTNRVEAVAARSYALHQRDRARAAGKSFDVESTTKDQAYEGDTTRPEALGAVRATRGQVLVYNAPGGEQILRAYYSSTCGGRSASASEVWPVSAGYEFNRAGPIQGRARVWGCEGSPVFRWQVQRDRAELERRFQAWGQTAGSRLKSIGTLASIQVIRANATGRPSRYAVIDASGRKVEVTAEELRVACNTEAPGLPAPDRKALIRSGDLEAAVAGHVVQFKGRGFGHGVGMCQYCAKGLADKGMDYQRMLALFYPGARIEKVY
jgi:stage II sporulation protein D